MSCCESCSGVLNPGDFFCDACGKACDPDRARGFSMRRVVNRGDTIQLDYDLVDSQGIPLNTSATGVKIWFTVKNYLTDADQNALAQETLNNGGIINRNSPISGQVRVTVPATATQFFFNGTTKAYYDLQVLDSYGNVTTVEKGVFLALPDVTQSTS